VDYVPIGLVGYRVGVSWPRYLVGEEPVPEGDSTVEVLLHDLGRWSLLVDLAFPGAQEPFRALVFLDLSPRMSSILW
jgi:hypothetical protein